MSSSAPLELVTDDKFEYLYLEEEEDVYSNDSNSDDDTKLSEQNAQDIFYLIRHNKKKYIKYRLNSNYPLKVNTTNNTRITPTMSATIFRRHGILRILLSRPEIRINTFDEHSMSALLYAASNGDQRCLKYLLMAGADPAHFNTERRNVLHMLILRRHFNSVLYLLEFPDEKVREKIRAVVNAPDIFGMTPLLYACELGHRNLAKYLVQCGADYKQHDSLGRDCLSHSIQSKDHSLVQYFIHELSFDTNRVYELCRGFTPLFYATAADSPELIMLLLDAGAKIDTLDAVLGETALLYASRIGKISALNTLLFCGANPNAANKNGTTALLELVKHDLRDQLYYVYGIQRNLIKPLTPFDVNGILTAANQIPQSDLFAHLKVLSDNQGYSPLIHAVLGDNSEAVTFLLKEVGCDIHHGDTQKRSPLYHAVANRHVRLFELLIDAGADYNTKDQDNNTVLMHAADSNNTSFVHSLIQRGADLTVLNRSKWSVLSFTCKTGNFDIFKSIIDELRVRFSDPANTCPLLSQSHLSLCLNVACSYGRPSTTGPNSQRQHASIAAVIVARNQATTQGISGTELLRGCQFANPNEVCPDLEPSIIAAVRNSGDNPTIVDYLFQSPNGVNVRVADAEGYTPTLLAVRLQFHNVIRRILQYEAAKATSAGGSAGAAPQQHAASAEIRCPAGLSPSDHACIIRHDKTFTEVRKRARAVTEPKKNKYAVSTGELLALGQRFADYLQHLYRIQLPYVTHVSKGTEMVQVQPVVPSAPAHQNEAVLAELDIIWLGEREESNVREGFAIITSLFELQIPEQSTYTPKTLSEGGNYVVPLVPRELIEEVDVYTNFLKSASIVEPFFEACNTSRPSKQSEIPSYHYESKSLIFVAVVGSKNLPLFLSLIQCSLSSIGNSTEADGIGFSSSPAVSAGGEASPAGSTPSARPGMPAARPGMPAARPGMPAARPGMPAARPGMPAARPGMPAARPGMPAATPGSAATPSPAAGRTGALRTDNINNENSSLLEILFAYAGYEGASVTGTNFLLTAITAAKYCPFWDEEYIFVGYNTKYPEKVGRTIEQLATDYKIPQALDLAKETMISIESRAKESKKNARV